MPTSMFWCYQCECEVAVTAARDEEKLCPQCNSGFVEELGHEGVGEDVGGSAGLTPNFHPELPAEEAANGRWQGENGIGPTPEENGGLTIWGLPGGDFAVGRFSSPRGSSSTTNESSSSRNSSVIFRRGFVSDLGIRAENQAQGRHSNPLSFLWPFRSSNTNSESSSSNNGTSK